VVQRLHHSIADGVDAVRLWRRLLSAGESPRDSADPWLGTALNVTALPGGDRLALGVNIDPAAVTEPGVLMSCLRRSFAAFACGVDRPLPAAVLRFAHGSVGWSAWSPSSS
jgi:hypothetical protein